MARDRIVELAATHAPADPRLAGSSYSTVVRVDPQILKERGGEAASVHLIADEEIAQGPSFLEAWARFLHWTEDLLNNAVLELEADTDDDEPRAPQLEESPILLLAAHNGARASALAWRPGLVISTAVCRRTCACLTEVRFDFPLLLCEVLRHGLPCWPFERWLFVDTIAVLQATTQHGCMKLQCLSLRLMAETGRAHRALDDCASLRQVMTSIALASGAALPVLLKRFGQELDLASSLAQLAVLMDTETQERKTRFPSEGTQSKCGRTDGNVLQHMCLCVQPASRLKRYGPQGEVHPQPPRRRRGRISRSRKGQPPECRCPADPHVRICAHA